MKNLKEMKLRELVSSEDVHAGDALNEIERRLPVIEAAMDGMEALDSWVAAKNDDGVCFQEYRLVEKKLMAYRAAKEVKRNAN